MHSLSFFSPVECPCFCIYTYILYIYWCGCMCVCVDIDVYVCVCIYTYTHILLEMVPCLPLLFSCGGVPGIKLLKIGNFPDNSLIRTWLPRWDSDCLFDYVNEVHRHDWLVGCVGWNQWTSVDSHVLPESIYRSRWKCREVMDPFDLLLQSLVSISEANIDPFKQSNLIEGGAGGGGSLSNGSRARCMKGMWFLSSQRWGILTLSSVVWRRSTLSSQKWNSGW